MGERTAVEESMVSHESTKVQLAHINEAIAGLAGKVDRLIDLTKTVAVMKVEADNHRDHAQQLDTRLTQAITKLDTELNAEEESRVLANRKIHARIDAVRKWLLTIGGGGAVALAVMGYVGEAIKGVAVNYIEAHDAALRLQHDVEEMKKQVALLQQHDESRRSAP